MRTVMFATLAVIAAALFNVQPASAASWTCTGPAFVCGGDEGSVTTSKGKTYSNKKAHKATASYDDEKPVRKAGKTKKVAKAVSSDDDDAPVRKGGKKRYSGGGSDFSGKASYYWQPQKLASGGWFNPNAMTAAHKTLPFGTKVRVTNQHNGQSVVVTINDRGPYVAGRVIDLSSAAAGAISMKGSGVVPVSVAVLGR